MSAEQPSPCQRGCCWTPYGHSVARDLPTWNGQRCTCHPKGDPR